MTSQKQKLLSYYSRATFPAGIMEFSDILTRGAKDALGFEQAMAENYAERYSNRCWSDLMQLQKEDATRGIRPLFEVVSELLKQIRRYPSDTPSTSREILERLLVGARPYLLRAIDSMTDREYEALGIVACEILGATQWKLTPPSGEGGIDFLAAIAFPQSAHFLIGVNGPLRLVGQCKKYASKVDGGKVREFIETLNQVKNLNPGVIGQLPEWFRLGRGPVIGWVIGHEGFQPAAVATARNHGIVLSDSRDITELVAMSKKHMPYVRASARADMLKVRVEGVLVTADPTVVAGASPNTGLGIL